MYKSICIVLLNLASYFLGFYTRFNGILYPYSDSIEPNYILDNTVSENTFIFFMAFCLLGVSFAIFAALISFIGFREYRLIKTKKGIFWGLLASSSGAFLFCGYRLIELVQLDPVMWR